MHIPSTIGIAIFALSLSVARNPTSDSIIIDPTFETIFTIWMARGALSPNALNINVKNEMIPD